jgi:DedD protein
VAETHEPSYYEIALTNRQVIVAFVLLLTCILGAFFSGVWIGREATARAAQDQIVRNTPPSQGPQDGKSLDELEFFDAKNKNKKGADHKTAGDKLADKPADTTEIQAASSSTASTFSTSQASPAPPASAPASTTLADDLARRTPAVKKTRTPAPAAPVEEAAEPAPAPAAPIPAPAPPARKGKNRDRTAAAAAAPARAGRAADSASSPKGAYVIQVFSSADKTQADHIRAKLTGGGQKAYLSPIERGGRTMYRVRIGPFKSRGDAQTVADKVRKGYKMDTWVTE